MKADGSDRTIVHVDLDAFYASVEQLDFPEYRGKPVVVGADPGKDGRGRGVVSAASYEARKFGIHSAMPISRAWRLCRHAIFVPPRFGRYLELSRHVMSLLGEFSPVVEQVSIDEAFLDCTGTAELFGPPRELGTKIKARVLDQTELVVSVGVAPNKFIAKIASDLEKPDGLSVCPPGGERAYLHGLDVKKLWGAGRRTVERLNQMGLFTVGDIAACDRGEIERRLGKLGAHLWSLSHGIDDRPVHAGRVRKSISEERTFFEDVDDDARLEQELFRIAEHLSRNMRKKEIRGRTITLKIRLTGFETFTRAHTLPQPVDDMQTIRQVALDLFHRFDREGKRVRLIGIGVSKLEGEDGRAVQLELFSGGGDSAPMPVPGEDETKSAEAEKVLDDLKAKFGSVVTRGSLLGTREREDFNFSDD